ncbi:MAG: hypothetical protein WDN24_12450 [Sphingomonas sp.]
MLRALRLFGNLGQLLAETGLPRSSSPARASPRRDRRAKRPWAWAARE